MKNAHAVGKVGLIELFKNSVENKEGSRYLSLKTFAKMFMGS